MRKTKTCEWVILTLDRGWGGVDWIDLARDRGQWRALVNTVMNLWVLGSS
jgi:hypothetical protein